MPIQSLKNLYVGVNPHLNSLIQTPGSLEQPSLYPTFHAAHINHIADLLNEQLPSNYTAYGEQSLQVRGLEWGEDPNIDRPQPIATLIREAPEQASLGRIVARIELLSSSNKNSESYTDKRIEAMENGTPLIEIDYLHETTSPIPNLPTYPHDAESHPYYIAVSDPRPTWDEGRIRVYGFDVGEPVTTVPIPLADGDEILFDFDTAYQRTFTSRRFGNLIDYALEPERFHTYSPTDQQRIHTRMTEIAQS